MKKPLLLLTCLFLFSAINAQSFEIERLKKLINEHPQQDTFRVNRLNELCNSSPRIQIDQLEKFAAEALSISRKIGYLIGEGYALGNTARSIYIKSDIEAGVKLLEQAKAIAEKSGDQVLQFWVLVRFSGCYVNTDSRLSLSWALKSEDHAQRLNNVGLLITAQNNISSIYVLLGDYARGMEYGVKALKNAEEIKNPLLLAYTLDNIGSIYTLIGEYGKTNIIYQKSLVLYKQLGFGNSRRANLLNALGENSRLAKKYSEAINYYEQALNTSKDPIDHALFKSNIADVYVSLDSLPLAFRYGFESLAGFKKGKQPAFESWVHGILANAYIKNNLPDSALFYARLGYDAARKSGVMEDMRNNAKALADAYALKNDFKNAYTYHNLYINYRDSMMNDEVKIKSTVLEHNYEIEKKEGEITLLNQQKKVQKNFLSSALAVLALIIITAILLLRNNRQKQKANTLLQKQKQEIDEKAKELAIQKDNLEQSYNNVELLGEIGRKITSSLSVNEIIGTVYDNVNSLMDAAVFGIGIYHDDTKAIDFPATYEKGQALPSYSNSIYDQNRFAGLCFISGKEIVINDLSTEYGNYLQNLQKPVEGDQPASLIYLPLKVKDRMFGVVTVQSFNKNAFSEYQLNMLRTIAIYAAIALENAESYKKLNVTVNTLQDTQKQLIHSEKMASLGELTAGIAHEIQNPLNFVNNFSEINEDLLEEMEEEIQRGNLTEVVSIAKSIGQNQQKINQHGKRADAIVKGMLQHSQKSTGEKFPTDINSLADEYLRLAYHGLRAKDKSFNVAIKTDFDNSIGKITIIPQDMGRVLLNLYNNAFYSLNEKTKQNGAGYEPFISVSTKRNGEKISISVTDNGGGIPQRIVDKIFQPFFTTKPTGQGTGLGLSLSYDIITKGHNGQISVDTKDGEGTTFTISIAS